MRDEQHTLLYLEVKLWIRADEKGNPYEAQRRKFGVNKVLVEGRHLHLE